MMSIRYRTKMFEEYRVAEKVPGAAPGSWVTKSKSVPLDEAINFWLEETGHTLVACTSPGIHVQWLNKELTIRSVIISTIVTYQEGPHERTVSVPAAEPEAGAAPIDDVRSAALTGQTASGDDPVSTVRVLRYGRPADAG